MAELTQGRRYDLWFKNPNRYYENLIALGESQVMFDYSTLLARCDGDARSWMRKHFHGLPWRAYIISKHNCNLIDYTCGDREHLGSWPVWDFDEFNLRRLEDLIKRPWSEREVSPKARWWMVPIPGQPHRIFTRNLRNGAQDPVIRSRRLKLTKIQRAFPEVEIFANPYLDVSMPLQFGAGFTASCSDVAMFRMKTKGEVILPNGAKLHTKYPYRAEKYKDLIEFLGYDWKLVEAGDWDTTNKLQITSLRYAAHHWDDPTGPFVNARKTVRNVADFTNPDMYAKSPTYSIINNFRKDKIKPTDKILCDSCSLWRLCPAYRAEEVCGLPGTESKKLSEMAKSRNADEVVEMLATIVSKQAERVEKKMDDEQFAPGGHDKDIDKQLNNLFKNGTQLAKLRNPNLGRPLVQINTGPQQQNNQIVAAADPRALAASIIEQIEATGVRREDITDEMISEYMAGPQRELEAIEAEVVDE